MYKAFSDYFGPLLRTWSPTVLVLFFFVAISQPFLYQANHNPCHNHPSVSKVYKSYRTVSNPCMFLPVSQPFFYQANHNYPSASKIHNSSPTVLGPCTFLPVSQPNNQPLSYQANHIHQFVFSFSAYQSQHLPYDSLYVHKLYS